MRVTERDDSGFPLEDGKPRRSLSTMEVAICTKCPGPNRTLAVVDPDTPFPEIFKELERRGWIIPNTFDATCPQCQKQK